MLAHVPSFGRNPRGSPDFLAYPVPKACMHVLGTRVPRRLGVARSASSPKAALALGCSLTPGLRISFGRVTCMARAASVPGLWALGFLLLACVGGWVRVAVGRGFCFHLPVVAGVLGGCVWARFVVLSLFCRLFVVFVVGLWCRPAFGTCVVSCAFPLPPAAVWACVLGPGLGCAPPFLAGLSGCVFFFFCFFFFPVAWCPRPGPSGLSPRLLSFWLGCWLFFFFVCLFRCPFSRWAAVPGLVLPVFAGWSPCACLGVLSSVPSGGGGWPPFVFLAGGLVAVGSFRAAPLSPPPFFFFFFLGGGGAGGGGGLAVSPFAFPRLALALWLVCGVVGPSPLLAEVPVCYSPPLLAGFRCRWWWAVPATPGWGPLAAVVCGVWCVAVVCWWGCGWCVVWLVPRHSWRRFLCATPRHSWLGFAGGGGVWCVVCGVWRWCVVGVVVGVCCGWSLATPGGGPCVLLPATPGWVSLAAVVCGVWCVVCGGGVLLGLWLVCGVVGPSPLLAEVPVCYSPPLLAGFRCRWRWAFPATPGWGPLAAVVCGVWCVVCGGGVLLGLWLVCGVVGPSPLLAEVPVCYSPPLLAGFRCRLWWAVPATHGWGPLAAVVCGVWCVAVVCWWGCGWCVVWLVPRHSWRRFLCATPRHSWLGFAGGGGVWCVVCAVWRWCVVGVVVGVWCGWSLATPGGGPCVLLPATPGWVSLPVAVGVPRHSWLGSAGSGGVWCVVCGVWRWCVVGVVVGVWCGWSLATPGGGPCVLLPATPGWGPLAAVVCGVWCVAVVCWWGCGWCVVWLVPRHSWRRFLYATPRHSWLGFAGGGGVWCVVCGVWRWCVVGVVVGVWCGWSLATPGGGPSVLLPATPGWVSLPVAVGVPRHSWLGSAGGGGVWCVVCGVWRWCVVGVVVGVWCGWSLATPGGGPCVLLPATPGWVSLPLVVGGPRHSWLGSVGGGGVWCVVCGVWWWCVVGLVVGVWRWCVVGVVVGVWCGWSLATPGGGPCVLLPATPGWVSLPLVVGGPRHSWLRSVGGGGVWCVVCGVWWWCVVGLVVGVWRWCVVGVVVGVWCGWSLATPGGGPCVLLPATPGWVSLPLVVGGPRHSWLGSAGGGGVWCVFVCVLCLAGSGGPASRARSGAPHLFLWPLCLPALPGPLRARVAPLSFAAVAVPRWLFFSASRCLALRALPPRLCLPLGRWLLFGGCSPAPLPFCVSRFSSLLLGAFVFFFFFFSSFFFFLCAPPLSLVCSGFRPRVPWASALAVFALFAFRFSALRALVALSCFPPGCWLLPRGCCPPPPPFVFRGFRSCRSLLCAVWCCASLGAVLRRAAARCVARCSAVVCCVALVWCRCLLRRALWRCPSPWGPVLCGTVFCGVPPRCVLCAVYVLSWRRGACCCSPLCLVLCVSRGAVLCVPCALRSVRCCASLCWCARVVLFVWCVLLLLAPGAVVRCCVLCCFLWCAVVRCWVWWPVAVCWWRVSVSVSLSGRVVCFPVVGVVCCGALLSCVVFCGAVLSRGAVLLCSAVVLRCCWGLLCPPVGCRAVLCCAVGWLCCLWPGGGVCALWCSFPRAVRSLSSPLCALRCLVVLAVVPCFPVSCAVALCCRVVLCCRALLSFCGAVCVGFALLRPVVRRQCGLRCCWCLVLWRVLVRCGVSLGVLRWWCCSGVSWCLAVLCVVLWCPAPCAASCGAVLPCGAVLFVFPFVLFSFAKNPCRFSVPLKTF